VIENSVIGLRCMIGEGVTIRDSIVMGADYYEQIDGTQDMPVVGVGDGSVIEGAIIDKNCRIGRNVHVANQTGLDNSDEKDPCVIRDGIPVVIKDGLLPDNWTL
jgi:glucose-1-phosphate adenylyltransferase